MHDNGKSKQQLIAELAAARDERDALRHELQRTHAQLATAASDRHAPELIGIVAHELRTPIHHIKGYAAVLLRSHAHLEPTALQEYLQIIEDETDKLERLIGDLVQTSQLDGGTLSLEIESVDLGDLIHGVVRRWQEVPSHRFSVALPPNIPPIPADGRRIAQILDNLLSNVVRHTPQGTSATVQVDVERDDVTVAVSDHGPGISPEHLSFVFDRFYQAGTGARRRGGIGLGLYISKGIVEQHGGRIVVEATPGSGTTFRFSLPRRRSGRASRDGRATPEIAAERER